MGKLPQPPGGGRTNHFIPPARRYDEPPTGYSSAGCSPAEPASASPAECYFEGVSRPLSTRLKIRLTRHRGFRDGYPLTGKANRQLVLTCGSSLSLSSFPLSVLNKVSKSEERRV